MTEYNQMDTKLLTQIKEVLSTFPEYWEGDTLLRTKVAEDIRAYNEKVIEALLSNELIKSAFSIKFDSTTIFKTEDFISMLRYKNYWKNSYTKYSNEIGLTSEGKYLKYNTDIALDFPHKDCVLEGGMTKEDVGKNEVYYHNVLAKEEVDTLLAPKVLTNIKKYDENGEHKVTEFKDTDNLIIKGNNLIALHTLKERYAKSVKQIYIDPPYYFMSNKSEDSFNYNSNFKLSTWLTFMKNRLEAAKNLLREDGVIFVQANDDGLVETDMLLQDIFGKENKVANIAWRRTDNQSNIGNIAKVKDYIIIYAVNISEFKLNRLPLSNKAKNEYRYEDSNGKFRRAILLDKTRGRHIYDLKTPSGKILKGPWMKEKKDIITMDKNDEIYWTKSGQEQPYGKIYLHKSKGQIPNDFWDIQFGTNQRGASEISKLFNNRVFDFPKPEKLMENIIRIGSNEKDIILDFHMGSATTQAVAHKMNRQYIGVEQMDYINDVSVPRLEKVIEGEQGGISKDVEWKGGGSFVYAELHSLNDAYIKKIISTENEGTLDQVLLTMKEDAYLNFKVDLKRVTYENQTYKTLKLDEKKKILIRALDMNQLYLNYSEIEDTQYEIPDSIKQFNHSFYQKESDEK